MAPAGPKVDDDSYRALHDPLHHHAHRQVSLGLSLISSTHFSPFPSFFLLSSVRQYLTQQCVLPLLPRRSVDFLLDASLRKVYEEGEKHK